MRKKLVSFLLSLMLAVSSFPAIAFAADENIVSDDLIAASNVVNENVNEHGLAKNVADGAILHTWCWSFKTITENMQNIAAAGFSAIQCSPIMECREGGGGKLTLQNWYYHYQATDYTIGNYQLGTKEEFEEMCDVAHSYGLKVIVDTVINHMTSSESSIAEYLRAESSEQFPNGFLRRPRNTNWSQNNRYDETQAELSSLRELNTQDEYVQQYIKDFLTECVEAGADGFRFDAAKLIELPDDKPYTDSEGVVHDFASDFWPTVLDNGATFQYGEDLQEGGYDATSSRLAAYQKQLDATTASFYGWALRDEIISQKNVSVDLVEDWRVNTPQKDHEGIVWKDKASQPGDEDYVDVQKLVTWVESHDSYCNDASYKVLNDQEVILGWAIIAARDGGTPLFFSRPMNSSASNHWGNNVLGAVGNNMYKDPQVTAVNFFRNEMGDAPEYLSNPNGNTSVLMIERGDKGCVLINTSDEDVVLDGAAVQSMADGVYPDQVAGGTFTVQDGEISGTVPAGRVAVAYVRESQGVQFAPDLGFSMDGGEFTTDTVEVSLTVKGCENAYYQINDGEKIAFKDGETITLGQDLAGDESVTITITGITEDGTAYTKSATFTKKIPKGTTIVYFDSSSYPNWNKVNLYAYGPQENAGWPGLPMEDIGGGFYKYVMPYALESSRTNVIFNNGGSGSSGQYPTGAGLVLNPETQMLFTSDKQWVTFDKAYVSTLYDTLKETDSSLYTTTSYSAFTSVLTEAEQDLSAEKITPDELMVIYQKLNNASDVLIPCASKESVDWLKFLINLYADFKESDYTADSWDVFDEARANATDLAGNLGDATTQIVEDAAAALADAASKLVAITPVPDTTLLAFYIDEAENLLADGDKLTPLTKEKLELALANGKDALTSGDQNVIDTAADTLLAAINAVREKGDKTLLKRLVNLAKTYQQGSYTDGSWSDFLKALSLAEKVLDDENMGNEEVEFALNTLNEAIEKLHAKANFASLEAAIRQAEAILANADDYVTSTLEGLQEELDSAKLVLNQPDISQDEVDAATKALAAANAKVRLKADLSALEELMAEIESLDLTGYTLESVAILQNAMEKAAALTVNNTQEEVDLMVEELSTARNALQKSVETPADNTNSSEAGENEIPTTGDNFPFLAIGILALMSSGCAILLRRKAHNS